MSSKTPDVVKKSELYAFRLTPEERELLDAIGTPVQWRAFITVCALGLQAIEQGTLKKEVKELDFAAAFNEIFKQRSLKKMTEESFSKLIAGYLKDDR